MAVDAHVHCYQPYPLVKLFYVLSVFVCPCYGNELSLPYKINPALMCIHTHMLYRKLAFYACVCMHGFDNSSTVCT